MKRRAIAIVRVSTDLQDCERQRRDIAAAARAHNLTIIRTLELEGLSGTKMLSNAEVGRVLDDLSRSDVDGVCISSIDRLTRPGELGHLAIFDAFQRARKLIWTPGQEIDVTTQTGFLTLGIQGVISGVERMTIIGRLKGGKETVRLRGGNADGGKAIPRGLTYSKAAGWSYTEPDATRMRKAYDLLLERRSWRDIAARVGGMTPEGLRRSLMNTVWKGIRTYTEGRETPLEVSLGIKPLISPAKWEQAQRVIRDKHDHWARTKHPPRFLLSGLLTCACSKPMYIRVAGREDHTRKRSYYYCSSHFSPKFGPKCGAHSIQQEAADREVVRIVSTLEPALVRAMLGRYQAGQPARSQDAQKLARERAKLEAERQRLLRLVLKGIVSEYDFERESKRIEAEMSSLDALQPVVENFPQRLDPAKLVIRITRTFARFQKQPFDEQRDVLRAVFREIIVENGAIPSMTLNGAFAIGTNSSTRLKPCIQFGTSAPDVILRFPEPIPIPRTDGRRKVA